MPATLLDVVNRLSSLAEISRKFIEVHAAITIGILEGEHAAGGGGLSVYIYIEREREGARAVVESVLWQGMLCSGDDWCYCLGGMLCSGNDGCYCLGGGIHNSSMASC